MSVIVLYFWRYFAGLMWPKSRGPFLEKSGKTLAGGLWACHAPQLRDVSKECVTLYKVSHLPAESLFQSKQKLRSACLKGKLKLEFFCFSSPVNLTRRESYNASIKIILGRVVLPVVVLVF